MKFFLIGSFLFFSVQLFAQSIMAVAPNEKQGALKVPVGINTVPALVTGFKVEANCYGTNNRHTTNPLSPQSTVRMVVTNLRTKNQTNLTFPSRVTYGASVENWDTNLFKCSTKYSTGLEKEATCMPNGMQAEISDTDIMVDDLKPSNFSVEYYQSGGGIPSEAKKVQFLAYEGKMESVKTTLAFNQVKGQPLVFIKAEFPGQDGFCGGFHSPLMLFFDDKQPTFSGKSAFLLRDSSKKLTFWPEKNHPGFFLVYFNETDHKLQNPILFSANSMHQNGFKNLAVFDENKDNFIDEKDFIFSKLYLWNDENGDGKSQRNELSTLKQKFVTRINLKYDESYSYDFGERAKAKGKATFLFLKNGKNMEGKIFDIYMNEL